MAVLLDGVVPLVGLDVALLTGLAIPVPVPVVVGVAAVLVLTVFVVVRAGWLLLQQASRRAGEQACCGEGRGCSGDAGPERSAIGAAR